MNQPELLDGITSRQITTSRLTCHLLSHGPESGVPVVFLHGNISSSRFWETTLQALPDTYWGLAPDLRGFGDSEAKPVDATRGLKDFSDDLYSLLETLGLVAEGRQIHLIAWSMGGGIAMQFAIDYADQLASLVLVDSMSPYGFGGTKDVVGTPCWPDYAGSGAGAANPKFVQRLKAGDRSEESNFSPRQILNKHLFRPPFRAAPEHEETLVSAMLKIKVSPENYPGDRKTSTNWPGIAPGVKGVVNALSPKYCNLSHLVDISPKPDVLWVRGDNDHMVSDTSSLDVGYLGQFGLIPGWPGENIHPPQPMISQLRALLEIYQANGGRYREAVIAGCAHTPYIERPDSFRKLVFAFLNEQVANRD